ncbi:MAG: hypothetical protein ACTSVL_12345 [Promethearchaeota archaeon]
MESHNKTEQTEESVLNLDFGQIQFEDWEGSSIERHDRHNFEINLDYHVKESNTKNRYQLEMYTFIPNSFHINKSTYSKRDFFGDLVEYIRFKTPKIALSGVLNDQNKLSPLFQIRLYLSKIKNGEIDKKIINNVKYELRLLGCIVKSNIRDQMRFFSDKIDLILSESSNRSVNPNKISEILKNYLIDISRLQGVMVELYTEFQLSQISNDLRVALSYTDEYISYQIEAHLTKFLQLLKSFDESSPEIRENIIALIEYEQNHRKEMKSRLIVQDTEEKGSFNYWGSTLKKYIQSVLYLKIFPRDEQSHVLRGLYSVAAGLAMLISLVLGFIIVQQFTDYSWAYIILLVIGYIIKDRIKESSRNLSNKFVEKYLPDKTMDLEDPLKQIKIGRISEVMRYIKWKYIPPEILKIREASNKSPLEQEGKPEIVMKFTKNVRILTQRIQEYHERHGDINDIIRFNIHQFLRYLDDPVNIETFWDKEARIIKKISTSKVYHMNIIFKITDMSQKNISQKISYKKIRVILDQQGIQNIEEPLVNF